MKIKQIVKWLCSQWGIDMWKKSVISSSVRTSNIRLLGMTCVFWQVYFLLHPLHITHRCVCRGFSYNAYYTIWYNMVKSCDSCIVNHVTCKCDKWTHCSFVKYVFQIAQHPASWEHLSFFAICGSSHKNGEISMRWIFCLYNVKNNRDASGSANRMMILLL